MALEKRVQIIIKARDDARKVLQQSVRFSERFAKDMRKAGLALSGIGAGLTLALGKGIKVAAGFQDTMARVKAISGATGKEFEKLTDIAKELGRTTRFTASEAAEGLIFLAQAGLSVEEQIKILPSVLNAASATNTELGVTADLLTDIMTGYGLTVKDITKITDSLVFVSLSATTNFEQLAQGFKFIGPIAATLEQDFDEVAAALGILANAGFKASMGGTALRQMFLKLLRASPQTAEGLKVIASLERDLGDAAEESKEGVGKVAAVLNKHDIQILTSQGKIRGFTEIMKDLGDANLTQIDLVNLFATRLGQADALIKAASGSWQELTADTKSAGGVTDETAKIMEESLAGSMRKLKSATEGLIIALADVLIPTITFLVDGLTSLIGILNKAPGPLKAIVAGGLALTAVFASIAGPLLLLTTLLPILVTNFVKTLAIMKAVWTFGMTKFIPMLVKTIVKTWALVAARVAALAAMGPVGWAILAASAAAAVGGVVAIKKAVGSSAPPSFKHGGTVPGPAGKPIPIMAHGGERFLGTNGMGEGGSLNITFRVGAFLGKEQDARQFARLLHRFLRDENRTRSTVGIT